MSSERTTAVGGLIRDLRKSAKMSQRDLAAAIGVSVGHMSQLESGKSEPTISALEKIADRFGVRVSWFFDEMANAVDAGEEKYIVRSGEARVLSFENIFQDALLSPTLGHDVMLVRTSIDPGTTRGHPASIRHDGDENGLVLSGTLSLWIADECHVLGPNDAWAFAGGTPHRYCNETSEPVDVVIALGRPFY